ncbi:choice-of-anchor I family protein, partial [Hymenobacter agri]
MPVTRYPFPTKNLLAAACTVLAGTCAARAQTVPDLGFTGTSLSVAENAGSVVLPLSIRNANATASTVQMQVAPLGTATAGSDFTFAGTQTVTFAPGSTTATLTLPILDDATAEPAEYFTVRLLNPANATLTAGASELLVFIKDNDATAPVRTRNLNISLLSSYQNGPAFSGSTQINSAEIVAHDPSTQRLYVANSVGAKLDILNFASPGALAPLASISIAPYGNINSVAVRQGLVACAIEDGTLPQNAGKVVFFDQNGTFLKQLTVGSLPDMITYSPDGRYLLTANEGEPNAAYTNDPNGSISIIDLGVNGASVGGIAAVTQANVTTLDFTSYNAQAAALRTQGIRIFGGPAGAPSTVAQDLEPEYITISPDSRTAYVSLQENNALATIDLSSRTITNLRPMGYQDHSQPGFSFDASDQATDILLANWPVRGMRQPDAIATFELPATLGGGRYVLTANEGDAREYTGFSETVRLGDASYVLDPTAFPQAALLKNNNALGRLTVTKSTGDTDGDGDIDQIHAFGGRSFSILNAATGATVYDSGDLLERLTSTDAAFGSLFNASNTTGTPTRKNRSDDKGPEPEGVAVGTIRDTTYAFVSMERVGGVAVFNVNDPANPRLVDYLNNRSLTAGTGDLGPEGTVFVSAANSPTGLPLLILANEISSTVAVYGIRPRGTALAARNG